MQVLLYLGNTLAKNCILIGKLRQSNHHILQELNKHRAFSEIDLHKQMPFYGLDGTTRVVIIGLGGKND